jgi:hypothetical protein
LRRMQRPIGFRQCLNRDIEKPRKETTSRAVSLRDN